MCASMSCRRKLLLLLLLLLAVNGACGVRLIGCNNCVRGVRVALTSRAVGYNHAHSSALSTTSLSAAVMDASCKPRQHACTH